MRSEYFYQPKGADVDEVIQEAMILLDDLLLSVFQPLQQSGISERARQQAEYRTLMVWLAQNKQESPEFKSLLAKILNTNGHYNLNAAKNINEGLK